MGISLIAAMSLDRVIGKGKDIPWHIPEEQKLFRHYTLGHCVVMGRITYESIGKALDSRCNIVVTRQQEYDAPGCLVVNSLSQAIDKKQGVSEELFVIGGEGLFREALCLADRIYLTTVQIHVKGDTFFPEFNVKDFKEIETKQVTGPIPYTFRLYERNR
ncbi:MAG: dihydrofolate reductase [Proteobacteria bacterium]|nr:dihydrofolate reductase [Pseudomonadota bacterium]